MILNRGQKVEFLKEIYDNLRYIVTVSDNLYAGYTTKWTMVPTEYITVHFENYLYYLKERGDLKYIGDISKIDLLDEIPEFLKYCDCGYLNLTNNLNRLNAVEDVYSMIYNPKHYDKELTLLQKLDFLNDMKSEMEQFISKGLQQYSLKFKSKYRYAVGLCDHLNGYIHINFGHDLPLNYLNIEKVFPELYTYKNNKPYWFDNIEERLHAVNNLITKIKPKIIDLSNEEYIEFYTEIIWNLERYKPYDGVFKTKYTESNIIYEHFNAYLNQLKNDKSIVSININKEYVDCLDINVIHEDTTILLMYLKNSVDTIIDRNGNKKQ